MNDEHTHNLSFTIERNVLQALRNGATLRSDTGLYVVARNEKLTLVCGYGALGCGFMWINTEQAEKLPGYQSAPTVTNEKEEDDKFVSEKARNATLMQAFELLETYPHTFRPGNCSTCRQVSALLLRPFGCEAMKQ